MKGDIIVLEEHHKKIARTIVSQLVEKVSDKTTRYTLAVAGESGSGKSETAMALVDELGKYGIKSVVLAQDDYFYLPPESNDKKRKEDPEWLGPHIEINFKILENNLKDAINGLNEIQDSFTEQILLTEHKIIAGHKQLADFIITKEYEVVIPD